MFKTMTGVLDPKKKPSEEEINKIPSFIFCRWLSGNPHTILAANQINLFSDIPIACQYQMVKDVFAGKIKYIPYPKKEDTEIPKEITYLMDYFKINQYDALEYLELIDPEELSMIIKAYEKKNE